MDLKKLLSSRSLLKNVLMYQYDDSVIESFNDFLQSNVDEIGYKFNSPELAFWYFVIYRLQDYYGMSFEEIENVLFVIVSKDMNNLLNIIESKKLIKKSEIINLFNEYLEANEETIDSNYDDFQNEETERYIFDVLNGKTVEYFVDEAYNSIDNHIIETAHNFTDSNFNECLYDAFAVGFYEYYSIFKSQFNDIIDANFNNRVDFVNSLINSIKVIIPDYDKRLITLFVENS